jgi:hypothetical protein
MAKRKKEIYLKKSRRSWQWPSRRETKRLMAGKGAPTGKEGKILLGKISGHSVRKRDIGKMNALKRDRKKWQWLLPNLRKPTI